MKALKRRKRVKAVVNILLKKGASAQNTAEAYAY